MLKGAVGGINPVIKTLSTNNLSSDFYAKFPHFQIPKLFNERTFYIETFKPSVFETPVSPNWITFLKPELLKINPQKSKTTTFKNGILLKVQENPIIKMNEDVYKSYKEAWNELTFLHLKYWEPNDVLDTYKFQLERFKSKNLLQSKIDYNNKVEIAKKCKAYYLKSNHLLRDKKYTEALAYSEKAILLFNSPKVYSIAIESLLNLIKKGNTTNQKVIQKWEKRILNESKTSNDISFNLLQIWVIINNIKAASFWLKKIANVQVYANQIEIESFYATLRTTETYKQFFKPLKLPSTSEFTIPENAKKLFPKFCKQLKIKNKKIHQLKNGANKLEISSAEKILKFDLGLKNFLSFWNGGIIANRTIVFSVSEILETNANTKEENIIIGRIGNGFTISTYNSKYIITQGGILKKITKNLDGLLVFCMNNS